jgi:iron complex outermembrane recepter protein
MFKIAQVTQVTQAACLALGGLGVLVFPAPAFAQQAADAAPQRVEVTGSSVRRIQTEGALPVQTITRAEIERSGASSVADLIQALPSMQGFTNEGASVGGGGNGFSGASLHGLGETRTLVLLNGRRLANFAGQTLTGALAGIDLNTIPISAIERIEILADGASALYGADAIGGVVNFITKANARGLELNVGGSEPSKGGREARASASFGFGDFGKDGFNVLAAANFEKRTKLASVDREFAKTGVINFKLNGQDVSFFNGSPRGIPANITHTGGYLVSPWFAANGSCPSGHVALQEGPGGTACYYDYVQQLEILPERERGSFMLQGALALGQGHRLFAEALVSNTKNTNRIAPPPGEVLIGPSSPFWNFVLQADPAATGDTVVPYRVADVGRRTQIDTTKAEHFVLGLEGVFAGWDYNASYTRSVNRQTSDLAGGYVEITKFFDALDSGLVNPFVPPGNQPPAALAALQDARILGFWEGGKSSLDLAQLRLSREMMQLPGGRLGVGLGVSFGNEKFQKLASPLAQGVGGSRFGDSAAIVPYGADRNFRGAFAEVIAPVSKELELSGALRYDDYSDFGDATTAKASFRFQPMQSLLLRGSLGTGFKAPTVPQVNATRQEFGVTSGNYTCNNNNPADPLRVIAVSLGAVCPTGNVQYNVFAGGNLNLKAEESTQWTLGMVFEPTPAVSLGFDLWQVKVKNQIGQLDEATIFGDPARWASLFTTYQDPGTGQVLLAMLSGNANLGNFVKRGLDLNATLRVPTRFGRWTSQLGLTYMLKDDYQLEVGGAYFNSMSKFGPDGGVTFRWQGKLANTLTMKNWEHTLTANFKSGYKDQAYSADDFAVFDPVTFTPFAYNGRVKDYLTFDWQTRWSINKMFTLTAGVLNVLDQDPPRSLKSAGGGQQIGYDDRYYDPRGRTLYANLQVKF